MRVRAQLIALHKSCNNGALCDRVGVKELDWAEQEKKKEEYNLGTAVKDKHQLFMHGISVGVLLPTKLPSHHSTEYNSG